MRLKDMFMFRFSAESTVTCSSLRSEQFSVSFNLSAHRLTQYVKEGLHHMHQ